LIIESLTIAYMVLVLLNGGINVNLDVKEPQYETYEVTAYTAGYESTGKTPSHPLYGITASGERVKRFHSVACPPELPFGTRVYIPYFDGWKTESDGWYECVDRGSAITGGKIDVYMRNLDDALAFGRRELDVLILPDSNGIETEAVE
jgi:3D (Asp-Asp-Asp) domain-containing protein